MGYHGKKEYKLIKTIGSGGQGKVVLIEEERTRVIDKNTSPFEEEDPQYLHLLKWKEQWALKFIYINDVDQINKGFQEYSNVKKLNHPNVAKYNKVYLHEIEEMDTTFMHIKMPYYRNGDLQDFLKKYRKISGDANLPPHLIIEIMKQLVKGVQYLHDNNILHRDLKPMNIFVFNKTKEMFETEENIVLENKGKEMKRESRKRKDTKEAIISDSEYELMKESSYDFEPIVLKLGDFGLSTMFTDHESMKTTQCGSPFYMAPEMFYGCYTVAVDYYSIGAILLHLMTQDVIMTPALRKNDYAHFQEKTRKLGYSQGLIKLMVQLLHDNPKKRPNCEMVLKRLEFIEKHGDESPNPQQQKPVDDLFELNANESYDSDSSGGSFSDKEVLNSKSSFYESPLTLSNNSNIGSSYYLDNDSFSSIQNSIQQQQQVAPSKPFGKKPLKKPKKSVLPPSTQKDFSDNDDLDNLLEEMNESSSSFSATSPVKTSRLNPFSSSSQNNFSSSYQSPSPPRNKKSKRKVRTKSKHLNSRKQIPTKQQFETEEAPIPYQQQYQQQPQQLYQQQPQQYQQQYKQPQQYQQQYEQSQYQQQQQYPQQLYQQNTQQAYHQPSSKGDYMGRYSPPPFTTEAVPANAPYNNPYQFEQSARNTQKRAMSRNTKSKQKSLWSSIFGK